jgi:hypothetical protein
MEERRNQLSVAVVFTDEQLIQVRCHVAYEEWAATSKAYTSSNSLIQLAQSLDRFAQSATGEVAWQAGADNGIGLIALRCYPIDQSRHIRCHLRFSSDSVSSEHRPEEVWQFVAEFPTEAGLLGKFAKRLHTVASEQRGVAVLELA